MRIARVPFACCAALWLFCLSGGMSAAADKKKPSAADDFRNQMYLRAREQTWIDRQRSPRIDRSALAESVEAARLYMLNSQRPEGNFVYQYDVVLDMESADDNQVRQAGALWGLTTLYRERPTKATRDAATRGLDFFFRISGPLPTGNIAPIYPEADVVKTGTVALTCLAIIEFCRGEKAYLPGASIGLCEGWLTQYINCLQALELDNCSWGGKYYLQLKERDPTPSPYSDGECLLAYCRAARYMGRKDLIPRIEEIAVPLAKRYTVEAWAQDPASDLTKGFAHWGCLAFAEYVEAGWKDAGLVADAALALAWWLVHEHQVLLRKGNTAYAVEALMAAHKVAELVGDHESRLRFRQISEQILGKLLTWQVGGPLEDLNPFLKDLKETKKRQRAHGGVMSTRDSGIVRIDTVQHQLHATLLALDYLFPDEPGPKKGRPRN